MSSFLTFFEAKHLDLLQALGSKALIVFVVFLLCLLLRKITHQAIKRSFKKVEALDQTVLPILMTASSFAVFILGLLIVFKIFGINTASILTLMGTIGLAIGLALKDTLSNIASGIVLLILRPFKVDHYIEFGSYSGTVKEVNLFTTLLETPDGIYVSAPNSCLWGVPLKNFSQNQRRRLDLTVGISYSDSLDKGLEVLKELVESDDRFLKDPAPQFIVHSMADSCVNLQLRAWLSVKDFWAVHWKMNKLVKEKIEEKGLSIPFPQRDLHVYHNQASSSNQVSL